MATPFIPRNGSHHDAFVVPSSMVIVEQYNIERHQSRAQNAAKFRSLFIAPVTPWMINEASSPPNELLLKEKIEKITPKEK